MAETKPVIMTEDEKEQKSIVFNHIVVQSVDRTPKDMKDYVQAMETAEQVYYPNRTLLYDLYSRIDLDGHLTGIWRNKRIKQVKNKKIRYVKDKIEVEGFDKLINSLAFRNLIGLIMESQSHGISGVEFIPGPEFTYLPIPRKHINTHERVIMRNQYDNTGIPYTNLWNIFIVGDEKDLGFYLKCAPYVLWKQGNFGDWAEFVQIFGHPVRIFTYDVYDQKSKQEALDLSKNAGSGTSMIIPKQLDFKMEDGKTSNANGDLQDKLRNACNEELSVIVLANTETTKSSKSSGYAQAQVHSNEQDEVIIDDISYVLSWINTPQFQAILKSYNYPVVEGGEFEEEEPADLDKQKSEIEIDKFLLETAKLPLGDDYFYTKYNRPKPSNYNELKKKQEQQKALPVPPDPQAPDPVRPGSKGNKKKKVKNQKARWKLAKLLSNFFAGARK